MIDFTGKTLQNDTKENVIFQLLGVIIQFWKKSRFYEIQSKLAHIQNSDCTVALKETSKLARHAYFVVDYEYIKWPSCKSMYYQKLVHEKQKTTVCGKVMTFFETVLQFYFSVHCTLSCLFWLNAWDEKKWMFSP